MQGNNKTAGKESSRVESSRVESSRVESSRSDKKQTKSRSLELESHPLNHGVRKITKEQDNRIDIQDTYSRGLRNKSWKIAS